MALLGARHTGGSDVSTYLNVDDSTGEFLLEVSLQGILSEPIAVDDLDNHYPSGANGCLSVASSDLV